MRTGSLFVLDENEDEEEEEEEEEEEAEFAAATRGVWTPAAANDVEDSEDKDVT